MPNPYYNYLTSLSDGQTVRAAQLNTEFQAIATAFDNAVFGVWDSSQQFVWTGIQDFSQATVVGFSVSDLAEIQATPVDENYFITYEGGAWTAKELAAVTGFDQTANYSPTGTWDFSGATVTNLTVPASVDQTTSYSWTGPHTYNQFPTVNGDEVFTQANINQATVPINAQTGTSYTCVLTDRGSLITLDNALAIVCAIPNNTSVAYPVGTTLSFFQKGGGQVTLVGASGVTLLSEVGLKLKAQYAFATAIKIATNQWAVSGSLSA